MVCGLNLDWLGGSIPSRPTLIKSPSERSSGERLRVLFVSVVVIIQENVSARVPRILKRNRLRHCKAAEWQFPRFTPDIRIWGHA